jgi:hypothetical protein
LPICGELSTNRNGVCGNYSVDYMWNRGSHANLGAIMTYGVHYFVGAARRVIWIDILDGVEPY